MSAVPRCFLITGWMVAERLEEGFTRQVVSRCIARFRQDWMLPLGHLRRQGSILTRGGSESRMAVSWTDRKVPESDFEVSMLHSALDARRVERLAPILDNRQPGLVEPASRCHQSREI
jgi:hypothetical protein